MRLKSFVHTFRWVCLVQACACVCVLRSSRVLWPVSLAVLLVDGVNGCPVFPIMPLSVGTNLSTCESTIQ